MLLLLIGLPISAHAQYFGQNKVQYETFDFKYFKTPHFNIYYYEREADASRDAGRMAERWRARLSDILGWQLGPNQVVILYDNHTAFEGTRALRGFIGETTGGVTEGLKRRVIMPFAGPLRETDHVLGHELVHAFQYDMAKHSPMKGGAGSPGILGLPLWFIEGMAEYLSVGSRDPLTAMWMRDAVSRNALPSLDELNNPQYFPYRWGQAFWAYVGGRYGDAEVGKILHTAGAESYDGAILRELGISSKEFSAQWSQALKDHYEPVLKVTVPARDIGKQLIAASKKSGLNVGPVVSPDGKEMMVFSQRSLFSIDIYLVDADTGAFERKITNTAIDPHTESLGFINSAGAWSSDGRQFVYSMVSKGKPRLAIYNLEEKKTTRKIALPGVSEVYNPTWSPDGRYIAFSGLTGGVLDLFTIDVQTRQMQRLTNDAFTELQPAWSPDGTKIAFVTDRFTSDLSDLSFGQYRLAIFDVNSKAITEVPGFPTGKHINPQWSPDSRSLYFISDRDGISNVYRVSLSDGTLTQITNIQTGVAGITALSPALSVASKTGKMVFSAFEDDRYGIISLDSQAALAGTPPSDVLKGLEAGVLPPYDPSKSEVAKMLADVNIGLVPGSSFTTEPYHPKLSLDYVAPPQISLGVSNFGTNVGGGLGFYFSDLLGYHNLAAVLETTTFSELSHLGDSISAMGAYQNERHRWSWGIVGGQSSFLSGQESQSIAVLQGRTVLLNQTLRLWQINRQVSGVTAYPFNRVQRVEFSAGYQRISYATELKTLAYDFATGQPLGEIKQSPTTPEPLNIGTGSAALVYDTSIFGGTSPILGQRYRFEVGESGGSLSYTSVLADYRRYVSVARPVSLAFRALHYGRYGGDTNDQRLEDLFLGYPSLVRGYQSTSFSAAECGANAATTGACPVFDRLVGSRIAVGSAEVRVQLLGPLGIIPKTRAVPPVEAAPFYDVGIAWGHFLKTPNQAVSSEGTSFRFNVFGYVIAQFSMVHPNNRPGKGLIWEFSLTPGF